MHFLSLSGAMQLASYHGTLCRNSCQIKVQQQQQLVFHISKVGSISSISRFHYLLVYKTCALGNNGILVILEQYSHFNFIYLLPSASLYANCSLAAAAFLQIESHA